MTQTDLLLIDVFSSWYNRMASSSVINFAAGEWFSLCRWACRAFKRCFTSFRRSSEKSAWKLVSVEIDSPLSRKTRDGAFSGSSVNIVIWSNWLARLSQSIGVDGSASWFSISTMAERNRSPLSGNALINRLKKNPLANVLFVPLFDFTYSPTSADVLPAEASIRFLSSYYNQVSLPVSSSRTWTMKKIPLDRRTDPKKPSSHVAIFRHVLGQTTSPHDVFFAFADFLFTKTRWKF